MFNLKEKIEGRINEYRKKINKDFDIKNQMVYFNKINELNWVLLEMNKNNFEYDITNKKVEIELKKIRDRINDLIEPSYISNCKEDYIKTFKNDLNNSGEIDIYG